MTEEPLTLIKGDYYFNRVAKEHFADNLDNIICQSDSLDVIQHMLMTKQSSALLPDFMDLKDYKIKKKSVMPMIECGIYVIWRDNSTQSAGKKFADFFFKYYNKYNKEVE